ncbi:MAG: hypothetical protein IPJ85_10325 [Flavobacteriales bacterium]|nr:hypothetical protein [Flavobacteriales bacterium]
MLLGFGYYNTRILNESHTRQDTEALQVEYERAYKPLANTALPHISAVDISIDLEPSARAISYHADLTLTNNGPRAVDTLWFGLPDRMKLRFEIPGAMDVLNDTARYVRMFRLGKPLAPGDSVRIGIASEWQQRGFGNDADFRSSSRTAPSSTTVICCPPSVTRLRWSSPIRVRAASADCRRTDAWTH